LDFFVCGWVELGFELRALCFKVGTLLA
jgi:hypothetical protein